ncbi:MAG: hotdog domain-containing protein [Bdellovibrionota bacterium]
MKNLQTAVESLLRVRISDADAHYAGKLVDGAKMLQLFGDAATEILIREDGDEGLFRAYEAVEFLAPVRAGDYIEVRARLEKKGKTSRVIAFEAWKVIENQSIEEGGRAPSSAQLLANPLLVCKAKGTCVTPLALQRTFEK